MSRVASSAALTGLFLALCAATLSLVVHAGPAVELNAARGISLDRQLSAAEEGYYGTRAVLLRGAVTLFAANNTRKAASYKSTTVFVPCHQHLTKSSLNELHTAPVKGMLIGLCEADTKNEELLSLFFASSTVPFPVYFIEGEEAAAVEALLVAHGSSATQYVVLSVGKSLRLSPLFVNESVPTYQIHSTLLSKPREGENKGVPRVLVTANFDTFGVAPSTRTTGGASGTAAAMELYRRESAAAAAGAVAGFGLSVLLGSSARFNYAATAAWLQSRPDREMDRFKLVISLEDLLPASSGAAEEPLYMHVQDTFMRRADGKEMAALAQKIAAAHGVELKVQPARTDYQHYDLRFEHEVFANRQLPAATFSAQRAPAADQIFRGSVRQVVSDKAVAVLAQRVAFLQAYVEALLELNDGTDTAATRQWVGTESYLAGLIHSASQAIRSPLSLNGKPLRAYAEALVRHIRQIDVATRAAASGAASGVTATTTLQSSAVKATGIVVHGPYEETMKLFVAKTVPVEASTMAVVLAALALFGISEFGISGLKKVILGW